MMFSLCRWSMNIVMYSQLSVSKQLNSDSYFQAINSAKVDIIKKLKNQSIDFFIVDFYLRYVLNHRKFSQIMFD